MNAAVGVAVIGVTAIWWLVGARGLMLTRIPGTDVHEQAARLIAHPQAFLTILSTDMHHRALAYYIGLVGWIGWATATLPPWTYATAILGMLLAICIRHPGEPTIARHTGVWQFALVAGSVVLVELALYLTWSPVGSPSIEGVQGRYFLPLLGLFLFALHTLLRLPPDKGRARRLQTVVLALALVQALALDATVASTFSLF